ncbi:transcription termination factor Rho [[Collinsella] massiliensis]|uniref:Transcription termination factor Rho n=1 Tax=[Collinsella] massiliensis TaxID=1232426 RepID=A0A1Y3XW37_9ACTN|nr:transcription termination factor Rho [[Collinsella] massiliensis]OUN86260.1 transcription termination factor Rho [[Collinsella] massiliensis]
MNAEASTPTREEKPRRATRTRRTAKRAEGEEAAAEEKPRQKTTRTTRKRTRATAAEKADSAAATDAANASGSSDTPSAPLSTEAAQARALAQVSQASVVRRQRRAAARAERALTEPDAGADAPAAQHDAKAVPAAAAAAQDAAAPLVDPALRPHRRGRKPKAFVEAEKAAAAAAAAQAATSGDAASAAPASTDAAPSDAAAKTAPASDAAPKAAPAEAPAAPAAHEEAPAKGEDAPRKREQNNRRTHAQRREHTNGNNNGGNGNNGNDRRNRQQNRKNRNNRLAPAEPSLSCDDLAAMKVAELRERAKELDLDVAGMKKAELVEAVYTAAARAEGFRDIAGILDIANEGHGYIRAHGYMPSRDDAFVPANLIRAARLRPGDLIEGTLRPMRANDKFPGLTKIKSVNGVDPEVARTRPKFSDLTPIYPNEQLKMEHGKDSITGRAIDIVSPIGKGQRGLIVSPPKAGKTTILKKICQSIAVNNPEVHLICLLVDERPEEVTDMQRSIKGDVVASTFDMPADNHTRVSELVIERAKRIVEMGGDVVVVLDSITRLARAYNLAAPASGRILSGGVDSAALYPPKRFLGAARNIENGGSLTILASALVDTGSKMDEVIFEEFKGTGNMELKLDRDLADRRIFPAIDPVASGTRNEDLLIPEQMRPFVWGIRRVLAGMPNTERCAQAFIKGLKSTNTNEEFLIRSARRAQEHGEF